MGWTELPYNQDEIVEDILATAKEVRKNCENFVVLGIGGSALGPIAVFQALCHMHHNDLPKSKRKAPKFYVEDNVDPERMEALLDVIDIEKTMFNVVTKSGSTSETMSQYLIIMDMLKKFFPLSFKYTKDVPNLIIGILIQLVVGIIAGVLIGVLAKNSDIPYEKWVETIKTTVPPKFLDINLKAFDIGYNL